MELAAGGVPTTGAQHHEHVSKQGVEPGLDMLLLLPGCSELVVKSGRRLYC